MSWFAGIIATIVNGLADGINALVNATMAAGSNHFTNTAMGNIIMGSFFPSTNSPPVFGAGTFADVMDPHAVSSLRLFSLAFWAFGWTFFLVSIYLLAMGVAGAHESSIQRDRLKGGLVRVVVAALLIWVGPHFAVMVTQLSFYTSDYFLNLNPLIQWTPPSSSAGGQALLDSTVNFMQAILSIIVWVVYQFRTLFLYVWMLFFPLAMAFYANDRTRGITKMWWTEWIYQMLIPLGQSVVYGVASAVAAPATKGAALTAADVFVALAGTIGLLASAVYVRKLIEVTGQSFGASMMGSGHGMAWGSAAMAGGALAAGDMLGRGSVAAGKATAGKAISAGFNKFDNSKWVRGKTEKAIQARPEVHAGVIQAGASADDIMMGKAMAFTGDALNAGGVGLEAAASGGGGRQGFSGFGGGQASGGRGGSKGSGFRGNPWNPIAQSGTARAFGGMASDVKNRVANSNVGTWAATRWKGYQNKGGVTGDVGDIMTKATTAVAGAIGGTLAGRGGLVATSVVGAASMVSHAGHRRMAERENHATRLQHLRNHLGEVMENNQVAQRVPGISHLYDAENNTFQGLSSPAEQRYNTAGSEFVNALQASGMSYVDANNTLQQAEQQWSQHRHLPNLIQHSQPVQKAYQQAFSAYRPAQLDRKAKDGVRAGRLTVNPAKDPHKNQVAQSRAFLNDARNAAIYRR